MIPAEPRHELHGRARGEYTVGAGSAPHDELVAKYGHATLTAVATNLQCPVFEDNPEG